MMQALKQFKNNGNKYTTEDDDRIQTECIKMKPADHKKFIQKSLTHDITTMFTIFDDLQAKYGELKQIPNLSNHLKEQIGFELITKNSNIINAGKGVFFQGDKIYPGSLIAFMPGDVYLHEHLNKESIAKLLPDDDMMVTARQVILYLLELFSIDLII